MQVPVGRVSTVARREAHVWREPLIIIALTLIVLAGISLAFGPIVAVAVLSLVLAALLPLTFA